MWLTLPTKKILQWRSGSEEKNEEKIEDSSDVLSQVDMYLTEESTDEQHSYVRIPVHLQPVAGDIQSKQWQEN